MVDKAPDDSLREFSDDELDGERQALAAEVAVSSSNAAQASLHCGAICSVPSAPSWRRRRKGIDWLRLLTGAAKAKRKRVSVSVGATDSDAPEERLSAATVRVVSLKSIV